MQAKSNPIRLIVLDVDGTLTDGEVRPLDLELIAQLAAMNRAARAEPDRVAVTLCTGRQPSYVEALMQAIDGHVPAVYENGCGLYVPDRHAFIPHPLVVSDTTFDLAKQRLEEALVPTGRVTFQPGKIHSLSIFAVNGSDKPRLYEWISEVLGPLQESVSIATAASCLNIMPLGVNKGAGLDMLSEMTAYTPESMLGIGDSNNDLEFLAKVGFSAAPANANERIKKLVQYVSPNETSEGVREILQHYQLL